MKKFDLEAAKNGAAVCLRDGTPVKILDFDFNGRIIYKKKFIDPDGAELYELAHCDKEGNGLMLYSVSESNKEFDLFMAPVYTYAKIYINRIIQELYSGKICATIEEAAMQKDKVHPDLEYFGMAKIEMFFEKEGGDE